MNCLLQFSDLHIGPRLGSDYKGVVTRVAFTSLLKLALQRDGLPDAILMTGDLAANGEPAAYRWLARTLAGISAPVYCLPGNHDAPDRMRRALACPNVTVADGFDLGHWRVICLDSTVPGASPGGLSDETRKRLRSQLRAHAERPTLIALHHHPVASGSAWLDVLGLRDADALFAAIADQPQVRAVVWGHVHQHMESVRDGVRLLGCPATCIQFKPLQRDFTLDVLSPAYRWLRLHDDGAIETGIRSLQS